MTTGSGAATTDYGYRDASRSCAHAYLLPHVDRLLSSLAPSTVFDLGCGNGAVAHHLSRKYSVSGVDLSKSGIAEANAAYPDLRLEVGSVYDDLSARFGTFDCVVSLEVVEHLYDPRLYAKNMLNLVKPGGAAMVSTPFHGYWKNLALAVTGTLDAHFTALWDGGHVKFWSVATLSQLLEEAGFVNVEFQFVGRIPVLARSMIAVAHRPT